MYVFRNTGKLRPKGVLFFRLQVNKRVSIGISRAEVYERHIGGAKVKETSCLRDLFVFFKKKKTVFL